MKKLAFAVALAGIFYVNATAQTANIECQLSVFGTWNAGSGTVIEVADCGDKSPCGTILDLSDPDLPDGNNPDKTLQTTPLIGKTIIHGFKRGRNGWRSGRIYNPSNGKTYRSSIRLKSDTVLKVKGCIGPFCESQNWMRLSGPNCR